MRDLSASIPVNAPSGFSLAFLSSYVSELGGGGAEASLPLRYTVTQLAGLTLERDVTVRVDYEPRPDGEPAIVKVAWEPDATFFPSFAGMLHAAPDGDKSCMLTISGTYDAPGGVAGQIFDAVIGVRIAHATIERLLAQFRDAIEADYKRRMTYA